MLPLDTPARNRMARANSKVEESPKAVKNTVLPTKPIISTGRRPIRSESEPQIGENRN